MSAVREYREAAQDAPPVAWLGEAPGWVAKRAIVATSPSDLASLKVEVEAAHVSGEWASELDDVRRKVGSARIVLDLTHADRAALKRRARTAAAHADVILLPTIAALEHFRADHPELAGSTTLFRPPLDLEIWAPEAVLATAHEHSRELKRLRRLHRLAGPVVLYVGRFAESGGLAAAIDAVTDLHTRHPDLRLVAIPERADRPAAPRPLRAKGTRARPPRDHRVDVDAGGAAALVRARRGRRRRRSRAGRCATGSPRSGCGQAVRRRRLPFRP